MSRIAHALGLGVVLAMLLASTECFAQEIEITGPLQGACVLILARYRVPATMEWAYWVRSGVSDIAQSGHEHVSAFVGGGAELTTGVLRYGGFPAPHSRRCDANEPVEHADYAELRVGPWVGGETRAVGALVEGGVTAHLGTTDDYLNALVDVAPYGMFDLRVGAGYGAFPDGRSPHIGVGLGWGYRVVFERQSWGGACDPAPVPAVLADATLVRLVATVRRATDFPATEFVIALELSPTLALVPSRAGERRRRD